MITFISMRGCCGRNRMVVGFTVSTYHHERCEFEPHLGNTTLCDKVCQ